MSVSFAAGCLLAMAAGDAPEEKTGNKASSARMQLAAIQKSFRGMGEPHFRGSLKDRTYGASLQKSRNHFPPVLEKCQYASGWLRGLWMTASFGESCRGASALERDSWFPAGPESGSAVTQGLRPGLSYVAPSGLDYGGGVAVCRAEATISSPIPVLELGSDFFHYFLDIS